MSLEQSTTRSDKSRHLSIYEYFEVIQVEYICAVLRARIYPKKKDKEYWNKVAAGKKEKIQEVGSRNQLPTIFSDSDLETALQRRIYREETFPIFIYKSDSQRLSQEYLDLLYYYSKGSDVRFDIGQGTQIGKVVEYEPFKSYLVVQLRDTLENITVPVSKVVRIL